MFDILSGMTINTNQRENNDRIIAEMDEALAIETDPVRIGILNAQRDIAVEGNRIFDSIQADLAAGQMVEDADAEHQRQLWAKRLLVVKAGMN